MVAGPGAGDVEQVALGGVDLVEFGLIADSFDSCLQRQHVVIAGGDDHGAKLEAFREMHRADSDVAGDCRPRAEPDRRLNNLPLQPPRWLCPVRPSIGRTRPFRAGCTGARRRARWKIENEGFNTLKNQGYHLKHNFGHGDRHLSEALFVLNLLAFFMHQIFELVDGLYQRVRTFFSSRRAFWDEARSAFRLFLFTSWDQVLVRMNSPPEQLPPYRSR